MDMLAAALLDKHVFRNELEIRKFLNKSLSLEKVKHYYTVNVDGLQATFSTNAKNLSPYLLPLADAIAERYTNRIA